MKKALNAWTVPGEYSFEDMFRDVSAAGFDGIELNLDREGASAHSLTMDSGKDIFEKINRLSEKYRLPVVSISSSLYGGTLGSCDKGKREHGKDIIRKQIECALALGTDGILTVPGGDLNNGVTLLQSYENSYRAIDEMKSEIESAKVNVCLENVWNGFFMSPFDMRNFIDSFNCKYIKAYFDAGNVVATSDPVDWIDILGSRIYKVHVKDFKRNGGINSGGHAVNLLEGNIDWKRVVRALKDGGFDGYLTAELGAMPDCPQYLYQITSEALDIIIGYSQ